MQKLLAMRYGKQSRNEGRLEIASLEPKFKKFERGIRIAASALMKVTGRERASLGVYLVGRKTMDKNVLAFPAPREFMRPDAPGVNLGEIYLNPDYIKSHGENMLYMLVHGFLHLLGYDHMEKGDRITMERKERALMEKLDVPSRKEGRFA